MPSSFDRVTRTIDRTLSELPDRLAGGAVIAYSGGVDSSVLAAGLHAVTDAPVLLAHLDHRMDPDSRRRADRAADTAGRAGLELVTDAVEVGRLRTTGESLEAAARRIRYDWLEALRSERALRWIVTGHHADDQIETVILRLLFGSGLAGLAGIARRRGPVVRPMLDLRRSTIADAARELGLDPVDDPTNRDLSVPRNRVRHRLVPTLEPGADTTLLRLAGTASRAATAVRRKLENEGLLGHDRVAFADLDDLPQPLQIWTVDGLLRSAAERGLRRTVWNELDRQRRHGGQFRVDAGGGIVLRSDGLALTVERARPEPAHFSYTLDVPGGIEIPEISSRLVVGEQPVSAWMFEGETRRAAIRRPSEPNPVVTVRSRRPGDRLQPLGCAYERRLKEILIDRKVPREARDRIPLLCVDGRIAWVPGVTIDHRVRLRPRDRFAWVARLETARG